MICEKCKAEFIDDAEFCPICGVKLTTKIAVDDGPDSQKAKNDQLLSYLKESLSTPLFLVLTILTTVSTVFQLLSSNVLGLLLMLFTAIPMWSLYSVAKKEDSLLYTFQKPFQTLRKVAEIRYSFSWVGIIASIVSAVIMILISNNDFDWKMENMLLEKFGLSDLSYQFSFTIGDIFRIFGIGLIVLAVVLLILTLGYYRNLKKCAEEFCYSVEVGGYEIKHLKNLRRWAIVFAVVNGISLLISLVSFEFAAFLSTAVLFGVYLVASIWMKKFVIEK